MQKSLALFLTINNNVSIVTVIIFVFCGSKFNKKETLPLKKEKTVSPISDK